MENLGALSVLLAFCVTVFAVFSAAIGKYWRRPFLVVSAERAVYASWFLLTAASAVLITLLITGDYRLAYVAAHTNKAMSTLYKFTAWWGGQEGSLLLWSWLLSTYSAIVVYSNRRKFREMMPIVVSIMMTTLAFFVGHDHLRCKPLQGADGREKGIIDVTTATALAPAAVVDDGDPSAFSLSRIRRLHSAVRFRHGLADSRSSRARAGFTPPAVGQL
jgi:hypothetical protein